MFNENQIKILGVKVDALDKLAVLESIKGFLESSHSHHIATVNPEFIMQAQKDERFNQILNKCHLSVADGIGVLWAAKFLKLENKTPIIKFFNLFKTGLSLILWPRYCRSVIPERISGIDLMIDLCRLAAMRGEKVFLLGDYAGSADKAALKLRKLISGLSVKSLTGPWIGKSGKYNQDENLQVLGEINEFQPQILFVAFNHPKAQYWLDDNLSKSSSVKLAMGVGGAFDFISGKAKRAPALLSQLGLEWLWRLITQPWRWSRILTATFGFIMKVYRSS